MAALLYEYRIPLLPTFVSFPIPGPILRDNARGSSPDSLVLYIIHLHELRLHEILERERRKETRKEKKDKKRRKGDDFCSRQRLLAGLRSRIVIERG